MSRIVYSAIFAQSNFIKTNTLKINYYEKLLLDSITHMHL